MLSLGIHADYHWRWFLPVPGPSTVWEFANAVRNAWIGAFQFTKSIIRCVLVWREGKQNEPPGEPSKSPVKQIAKSELRTQQKCVVSCNKQLQEALNEPYVTHTQFSLFAKRNIAQNNGRFISTRMVYLCMHPDDRINQTIRNIIKENCKNIYVDLYRYNKIVLILLNYYKFM